MPFFIGVMDLDSAQADGKWNRLASYPAGRMNQAARNTLLDQIGKLLHAEATVFNNEMPWQTYSTMIVYDSTYPGASALEHQRSHVGVYTPSLIGDNVLTSITAHEMFHAWNVKRMRPAEMWPYRYGAEEPTPWLWVSEGITDYYADLAMSRNGMGGDSLFYSTTGGKIATVATTPPVALEDASLSTWIHPADGTGYIYYPKGSLAGFMLDIMIRDASNNRRSLDNVMRDVYTAAYKHGRGFTSQDWWDAVSRAAGGKSFADFNARYVDGREPYPWESVLPLVGLRLRTDSIFEPRLGINTNVTPDGRVGISAIGPGSVAEAAGIKVGDVIVSVGDVKITDQSVSFAEFRQKYATARSGSALPIVVRRNNQDVTLTGSLRLVPRVETKMIVDSAAAPKAVRIREGILRGKTDS
jgi:predicted metalloprotease with PDZ domain